MELSYPPVGNRHPSRTVPYREILQSLSADIRKVYFGHHKESLYTNVSRSPRPGDYAGRVEEIAGHARVADVRIGIIRVPVKRSAEPADGDGPGPQPSQTPTRPTSPGTVRLTNQRTITSKRPPITRTSISTALTPSTSVPAVHAGAQAVGGDDDQGGAVARPASRPGPHRGRAGTGFRSARLRTQPRQRRAGGGPSCVAAGDGAATR